MGKKPLDRPLDAEPQAIVRLAAADFDIGGQRGRQSLDRLDLYLGGGSLGQRLSARKPDAAAAEGNPFPLDWLGLGNRAVKHFSTEGIFRTFPGFFVFHRRRLGDRRMAHCNADRP